METNNLRKPEGLYEKTMVTAGILTKILSNLISFYVQNESLTDSIVKEHPEWLIYWEKVTGTNDGFVNMTNPNEFLMTWDKKAEELYYTDPDVFLYKLQCAYESIGFMTETKYKDLIYGIAHESIEYLCDDIKRTTTLARKVAEKKRNNK